MKTAKFLKNAIALYAAMAISVIAGLYTSRVIIKNLGVVDFGIYSVIGGLILLFSVLGNTMVGSVQRFMNVAIAKRADAEVVEVFSASVVIHVAMALIMFVAGEVVGRIWLLDIVKIPENRMIIAKFVYHCILVSLVFSALSVPAQAMFNAYERMSILAVLSLVPVMGRLGVAMVLPLFSGDKLAIYAILVSLVAISEMVLSYFVLVKSVPTARLRIRIKKENFKSLLEFASWGLVGDLAAVAKSHGLSIAINHGFGVKYNAAYGVAQQVYGQMSNFACMLVRVVNPQIIQRYTIGDGELSAQLVCNASKIGFFIVYIASLPFVLNANKVLVAWLGVIPDGAVVFARWAVVVALVEVMSLPLMTLSRATGKIKIYQLAVGILLMLNLPCSYILISRYSAQPAVVYVVSFVLAVVAIFVRLAILQRTAMFNVRVYSMAVLIPVVCVGIITFLMVWYSVHIVLGVKLSMVLLMIAAMVLLFGNELRVRVFNWHIWGTV